MTQKNYRIMADLFEAVGKAKSKKEKIELLTQHNVGNYGVVMRNLLKAAFDPKIKWALPDGAPPYKVGTGINQEDMLLANARKLYLFIEGGNPNLKQVKREQLYIEFLEAIHPKDAELMIAIKDCKLKGITSKLVEEAFPGLIEC